MKYKYLKLVKNKYFLLILFVLLTLLSCIDIRCVVNADNYDSSAEFSSSIVQIVDGLDLSEIESLMESIDDYGMIGSSIKDKVLDIINGKYYTNYSSLIDVIASIVLGDIRRLLPFVFTLVSVGILTNIIGGLKSDNSSSNSIVAFVCFSVVALMLIITLKDILNITKNTLGLIHNQMQIIFPLLITLLSTVGSVTTVSIYNPLVAVLTFLVSVVFDKVLYPLFIVVFLLVVVGGLSDTVKLNKLQGFLMSAFKWCIGIVFTVFTGFLSIQGITAGKFDSVSIKATKFAIKSYIPIIGSYISDGMDFIVLGSVLVKNTIGLIGILILFLTILSPIVSIVLIKLALQLASGIIEMSGSGKISSFINDCSKVLVYPIVLILGVSFMYLITIALIMCTANVL